MRYYRRNCKVDYKGHFTGKKVRNRAAVGPFEELVRPYQDYKRGNYEQKKKVCHAEEEVKRQYEQVGRLDTENFQRAAEI